MTPRTLSIFIIHPSDFLTNCQPHGDGLVAFEFINQLAQRGHNLHVAVASMDIRGKLPENVKLYPTGVKETCHSSLGRIKYMLKVGQIFEQVYREYKIDLTHQLNPVHTGLSLALRETELPMVLGPFPAYWPHDIEARSFKFAQPSSIFPFGKQLLMDVLCYQQQRQAKALLVSTPAAVNRLGKFIGNKTKIYNLPLGIDTALFSPASEERIQEKAELVILFLANLEYPKGIFTLLDAFEIVVAELPSCRLVIAGSGTKLQEVQQRIHTMSCQSQISLVGRVDRAHVAELMRQCSVYCLPSYGEPFGMSALEAMACGKPIVATNAGGLAHLVSEQGGRKVPPRDAQALAEALSEILRSPELQTKMGQYNRDLVERVYSWRRVAEQLESIYYELIVTKQEIAEIT